MCNIVLIGFSFRFFVSVSSFSSLRLSRSVFFTLNGLPMLLPFGNSRTFFSPHHRARERVRLQTTFSTIFITVLSFITLRSISERRKRSFIENSKDKVCFCGSSLVCSVLSGDLIQKQSNKYIDKTNTKFRLYFPSFFFRSVYLPKQIYIKHFI